MASRKKGKRPSLKQTVETLSAIAEEHLTGLPQEEQERRLAALASREFTRPHGTSSKRPKIEYKRDSRALARGRE